jgi:hypothetical protein
MEAIAAFGLVGLGYLVTKLSESNNKNEGFQVENQPHPPVSPLQRNVQGNSIKGTSQELDLHYQTPFGQIYPSEPNPGPKGDAFSFSGVRPPPAKTEPTPQPIDTASAQVSYNSNGIEENPNYMSDDTIVSALSGQKISSSDFTHNNMVPFFGSRVRQNVGPQTNTSILDSYTGSGVTQIRKKEVETMFNTGQTPFGNPFGLEQSALIS